jgi:beta-phosphoglucomutase-like phosphatase (HAD superfamily)
MVTINNIFKRFDLDKYFISKLSGADLQASKPHPEIFIKAAESSGFKKEECLVIEDSTNGIKAAKSAGIFCVGFDSFHSKNQDYSSADLIVKELSLIKYDKIKNVL